MNGPIPETQGARAEVECRAAALQILARRERTRRSLEQALRRRRFSPPVVRAVVARLAEEGLVDDGRFGRLLVEQLVRFRPTSTRALEARLRREGCAPATIQTVLQQARAGIDEFDDLSLARRLIEKKLRMRTVDRDKILGALARRGFTRAVAIAAWTAATGGGQSEHED